MLNSSFDTQYMYIRLVCKGVHNTPTCTMSLLYDAICISDLSTDVSYAWDGVHSTPTCHMYILYDMICIGGSFKTTCITVQFISTNEPCLFLYFTGEPY